MGLQAQEPLNPYTALWSRLDGFRPDDLSSLLEERRAVRIAVMRSTVHLVTAGDCLLLRPLMQPVLDAELARHSQWAPALRDVALEPVLAFAGELLAERPRSGRELRTALAERFSGASAGALAYACRNHLPLVQVPPRGVWGRTAQVTTTTAEAWLGRPLATRGSTLDAVVLRYFGAFGPASVADVTAWCRLTGLREVVERLRPRLLTFRDESGRELFDLPDAPRPDPATPAPPRFLPEYDNVLLSHADRSRFRADHSWFGSIRDRVQGTVLADGTGCCVWRIVRSRKRATLEIEPVVRLSKRATSSIAAEGRRYLRFAAADADTLDLRVLSRI